jgi:uncharacterized protein (TIGR02147 family)
MKKKEKTGSTNTNTVSNSGISIFEYFDYHEYLKDFYAYKKKTSPDFSHRLFLSTAGIPGTVYLLRIQKGAKLDNRFIPNFIHALDLNDSEAEYFKALVSFQNEKKAEPKELHCRKMLALRASRNHLRVNDDRLGFYRKWFYPVVRELACMNNFTDDFTTLANKVIPRIKTGQAQEAVVFLEKNGFIAQRDDGTWYQVDPSFTTADEVHSTLLRKFHKKNLEHCIDALDTVPQHDREISSTTLSISHDCYNDIKHEIQQFRNRLLDIAVTDKKPAEIVCHTGFQLIPRTRLKKDTDI